MRARTRPGALAAALLAATSAAPARAEGPPPASGAGADVAHVHTGQRFVFQGLVETPGRRVLSETTWTIHEVVPGRHLRYGAVVVTRVERKDRPAPAPERREEEVTQRLDLPARAAGPPAATLSVDGQEFPCQVVERASGRGTTREWTSGRFPFLLKRVRDLGPQGKATDELRRVLPADPGPPPAYVVSGLPLDVRLAGGAAPGLLTFAVVAAPEAGRPPRRLSGSIWLFDERGASVGGCSVYLEVPAAGARGLFHAHHRDPEGRPRPWTRFSARLRVEGPPPR